MNLNYKFYSIFVGFFDVLSFLFPGFFFNFFIADQLTDVNFKFPKSFVSLFY